MFLGDLRKTACSGIVPGAYIVAAGVSGGFFEGQLLDVTNFLGAGNSEEIIAIVPSERT